MPRLSILNRHVIHLYGIKVMKSLKTKSIIPNPLQHSITDKTVVWQLTLSHLNTSPTCEQQTLQLDGQFEWHEWQCHVCYTSWIVYGVCNWTTSCVHIPWQSWHKAKEIFIAELADIANLLHMHYNMVYQQHCTSILDHIIAFITLCAYMQQGYAFGLCIYVVKNWPV